MMKQLLNEIADLQMDLGTGQAQSCELKRLFLHIQECEWFLGVKCCPVPELTA